MNVALAALASLRDYLLFVRHHEVGENVAAFIIDDDGARRHAHDEIARGLAVLLLAAARFAVARDEARLVFEVKQRRHTLVHFEDDAAAAAAVAARRPAKGAILLAQERDRAIAALACMHEYTCLIDKSHVPGSLSYGIRRAQ